MIQQIVQYEWSEEKLGYVKIPLDMADAWTIEVVRRYTGANVSAEQIADLLDRDGWSKVNDGG